jgi:hypothetical protein
MIVETIMEQLVGSDSMDLLMDMLEEKSTDFAADRQRCADAVKKLQGAMLEPSVDDVMEAIFEQASVTFLFSLCLGLKDNLDHFMNPIARTFLEVDSDVYLRHGVVTKLPDYITAQEVREKFAHVLSVDNQSIYEGIVAFAAHLEMLVPKIGHYYGYNLGNKIFQRVVPGYCPDMRLTSQYCRTLENYLGIEM